MTLGHPRSTSRQRANWGALGSGCAGLLASLDAQAQTQPTLIQGHPTASVLLGAGVACAVALALLAWQRRTSAEAAHWREERARVQRLLGLIDSLPDSVVWRTDARHVLVNAQPSALGWTAGTDRPLWECFQGVADGAGADDSGADPPRPTLRDGLQAATGLLQVDVEPVSSDASVDEAATPPDGAPTVRWRLHALPCFDEHGRYAGHEGIARRLPVSQAAAQPGAATAGAEAGATTDRPIGGNELSRDAEALKQSEEAASFSYSVSHDLRAPIRVVEGFAKILKEDYGPGLDRIGNDHIDRVLGAAARMNNMIDALLALSRLGTQPLARQTVNLSQLATYVIEDLRRHTPDRRVEAIIEPGLQAVGDPILLRVALENLLGNAWKYSAQRTLATVEFKSVAQAGRKVFCVADNGAGFDMRFADRLFGVFQRLHSSSDFAGTGVGLATVRRIVHRHGGDIWAEAEVERGAKFYFTLPN